MFNKHNHELLENITDKERMLIYQHFPEIAANALEWFELWEVEEICLRRRGYFTEYNLDQVATIQYKKDVDDFINYIMDCRNKVTIYLLTLRD